MERIIVVGISSNLNKKCQEIGPSFGKREHIVIIDISSIEGLYPAHTKGELSDLMDLFLF